MRSIRPPRFFLHLTFGTSSADTKHKYDKQKKMGQFLCTATIPLNQADAVQSCLGIAQGIGLAALSSRAPPGARLLLPVIATAFVLVRPVRRLGRYQGSVLYDTFDLPPLLNYVVYIGLSSLSVRYTEDWCSPNWTYLSFVLGMLLSHTSPLEIKFSRDG